MPAAYDRREDAELLALACEEPDAFAVFYRRHVDRLLAFFMRRTRRADVALDLTAETFAAALAAAPRYRAGAAPAEAWLFGIARNKLAHSARRGKVEERVRQRLRMTPLAFDDAALELIERRAEAGASALLDHLRKLPEDQRRAVERTFSTSATTPRAPKSSPARRRSSAGSCGVSRSSATGCRLRRRCRRSSVESSCSRPGSCSRQLGAASTSCPSTRSCLSRSRCSPRISASGPRGSAPP